MVYGYHKSRAIFHFTITSQCLFNFKTSSWVNELLGFFLQEPDFQENEYMYDDFDLEADMASCMYFFT